MDNDERKVFYTLLIAAIILAAFIYRFVQSLAKHHMKNILLEREKTQVEIQTLEQERKRIACDLHDEVGPTLSAIKMRLQLFKSLLPGDKKQLIKVEDLLDEAIDKIRECSNNLLPVRLTRNGFIEAVVQFSETIEDTGKLKVELNVPKRKLELGADKEVHLFRIFQETFTNCIRHSNATTFSVKLVIQSKQILLEMEDDGKGFNKKILKRKDPGFGLMNIYNRVELLKGQLHLDTKPGSGVKYKITIPISN